LLFTQHKTHANAGHHTADTLV